MQSIYDFCNEHNLDLSVFNEGTLITTKDERVVTTVLSLHKAGYTLAAISAALNVSANFIYSITVGTYKTRVVTTGRNLDVGKIKALRNAGWSDKNIAGDMGIPVQLVLSVPR